MLAAVTRSIDDFVLSAEPTVERVHELHRQLRRLRVGLELWARLLPLKTQHDVELLNRRLKRLARLVGEVRDRDVVLHLLERTHPRGADPAETRRFHNFWGRLRDDAHTGRELLKAFLTTERDSGLFREVEATIGRATRPSASAELASRLAAEARRRREKVDRAHRRATRRPTSDRLHRLRIRLRQLRHVAELTRAVAPKNGPRIPARLRPLQDRLGTLHDLDVALATLDPELERSPWAEALRRERHRARTAARTDLGHLLPAAPRRPPAAVRRPRGR